MTAPDVQQVEIAVKSRYVPERSSPAQNHYFFAYHVTISNQGSEPVQLLSRHWVITDAFGHTEEVRGPGVVGRQPRISPGDSFEYTSACPLHTPHGSMHGDYQMLLTSSGEKFEAIIEPFALTIPSEQN